MINPKNELSVRRQCELLHIERSAVYYKPADRTSIQQREEELMRLIDALHTEYPCYGSRRLLIKLQEKGYAVSRKLIRRLMQKMGLYVIYPKPNLSKRDFRESVVPYLLRNKTVDFPNQVWSVDITYIPMGRSHLYLTALIDWFSRKIMGWTLSDTLDTKSVTSQRLLDLGFVPGTPVTAIKRAPMGDPTTFEIRGYQLGLRRSESEAIEVEINDNGK